MQCWDKKLTFKESAIVRLTGAHISCDNIYNLHLGVVVFPFLVRGVNDPNSEVGTQPVSLFLRPNIIWSGGQTYNLAFGR